MDSRRRPLTPPEHPKSDNPDSLETRCPRLGGTVPFRYCMAPAEPTPCYKVLDCWWEVFDVEAYLRSHVPEDVFNGIVEQHTPPNRLHTILDLVEKLKNKKPG